MATRTQAVALAGAVVCAVALYGWSCSRFRETVSAFRDTLVLYAGVGVVLLALAATGGWNVLGAYSALLHEWHLRDLRFSTALNATAFALSLGVLVAVVFPFGAAMLLRLEATDGERALGSRRRVDRLDPARRCRALGQLVWSRWHERSRGLFYVAPAIFACSLAWATRRPRRSRLLTACVLVGVVGTALLMPRGSISPGHDATSFRFWTQLGDSQTEWWAVMVAAMTVGVVAVVFVRSPWLLVIATVVVLLGGIAADRSSPSVARSGTVAYDWVDRAVPDHRRATILWVGLPDRCFPGDTRSVLEKMALYTEFFNDRVERPAYLLEDNPARGLASVRAAARPDGVVTTAAGDPLLADYVVVDSRIHLVGTPVATLRAWQVTGAGASKAANGSLTLWRSTTPVRLARPMQVLEAATRRPPVC